MDRSFFATRIKILEVTTVPPLDVLDRFLERNIRRPCKPGRKLQFRGNGVLEFIARAVLLIKVF